MKNDEMFLPLKQVSAPQDVKSALRLLEGVARQRNDHDLLLKIGTIQGTYTVYERTCDVKILEQMVLDIILLLTTTLRTSSSLVAPELEFAISSKPDLIYAMPSHAAENLSVLSLIQSFCESKNGEATKKIYFYALKRLCEKLEEYAVSRDRLLDLSLRIEAGIQAHPEYNRNTKSAASGFVKYLRRFKQVNA